MFHVSWCKVCQRTLPKFQNASDLVHEHKLEVDFAHVDCTDDKSLCQRFDVKGYPTIKFFPTTEEKEPMTFKSQRTEEGFLKYAQRMLQPPVQTFHSAADFASALAGETLVAFVTLQPSGGEPPAGLLAAAEKWRDRHIFAAAPRPQELLPKAVAPPAAASLAVLSQGRQQWPGADNTTEPTPVLSFYTGSLDDESEVTAWVERNRFPGIWVLGEGNFHEFTHASRRAVMLALNPAEVTQDQEAWFRYVEGQLKKDFIFGVLDGVLWADELYDFNILARDLPRVFVTEDNFDTWVEDINALRVESLEQDLRALLAGAPLLRQDRGVWSRVLYNKREVGRLAVTARAIAARGVPEAMFIGFMLLVALAFFVGFCWCLATCCHILLCEDPEVAQAAQPPGRAKRD